jgi:hypothetical protein
MSHSFIILLEVNKLLKLSLQGKRLKRYVMKYFINSPGHMQEEMVKQVKTMKDCVAALEHNEKSVYVVSIFIPSLIELISKTDKPSDFFYPAFKHDMIDDLRLLTDKHVKQYWDSKSDQAKAQAFKYIQSELLYSLVLLQMTLEEN